MAKPIRIGRKLCEGKHAPVPSAGNINAPVPSAGKYAPVPSAGKHAPVNRYVYQARENLHPVQSVGKHKLGRAPSS